jgi:hypothetical protein
LTKAGRLRDNRSGSTLEFQFCVRMVFQVEPPVGIAVAATVRGHHDNVPPVSNTHQ